MRFDVITIFPEIFAAVAAHGVTARAHGAGLWRLQLWNPREVTTDPHRSVDERPFGGGPGMVMMAEPLSLTLDLIRRSGNRGPVVAFDPRGRPITDALIREWSGSLTELTLVCGRYEGVDQRFLDSRVDVLLSLGDFVLSGGELPACALIDALVRQLPGVIKEDSARDESFATGLLSAPDYTRPEVWRGQAAPAVLLSGNHAAIAAWRRERALEITLQERPDLIKMARSDGRLSARDEAFLASLRPTGRRDG